MCSSDVCGFSRVAGQEQEIMVFQMLVVFQTSWSGTGNYVSFRLAGLQESLLVSIVLAETMIKTGTVMYVLLMLVVTE